MCIGWEPRPSDYVTPGQSHRETELAFLLPSSSLRRQFPGTGIQRPGSSHRSKRVRASPWGAPESQRLCHPTPSPVFWLTSTDLTATGSSTVAANYPRTRKKASLGTPKNPLTPSSPVCLGHHRGTLLMTENLKHDFAPTGERCPLSGTGPGNPSGLQSHFLLPALGMPLCCWHDQAPSPAHQALPAWVAEFAKARAQLGFPLPGEWMRR